MSVSAMTLNPASASAMPGLPQGTPGFSLSAASAPLLTGSSRQAMPANVGMIDTNGEGWTNLVAFGVDRFPDMMQASPASVVLEASGAMLPAPAKATPAPIEAPGANTRQIGPHDALYEYSQKLGKRVTVLESELSQIREERDNLKAENEAIGEHIFGLQQENGMLHDIGWTSYLEKAQLAKAAEGVSTDASHLRNAVQDQKQRIEYLSMENKNLLNRLESWKSDRNQWQHQIRGLEVTLETVQGDLQKRINREGALKERGVNLERCLDEVQGDKVRLDDMVSLQHVEIAKLQQVTSELHAERARSHALTQKMKSMEAQLGQVHHEKSQLDSMVGTLHVEVAQLVTQRDSVLTEVPQLQGTVRQQSTAVADLQEQVRNLQSQNHELHRRNVNLDAQVKEIFSALDEAKKASAHHERNASTLHMEKVQLKRQTEDLAAQRGEVDQRLNSVMSQKGIVHAHFEQVSGENNQLQMAVQQSNSENAALKSRLAGMEKLVQGYQDEIASLQQRTQLLRSEKEEIQEHMQQLQPQRLENRFLPQGAL